MLVANVYKGGSQVDSFEYPEPKQANRVKENIWVIKNGGKVGKEYRGGDFGRLVVSQLPYNYSIETLAKSYSASHKGCFWVILEDASWGK